jgi:single-strand DNA-binding protein
MVTTGGTSSDGPNYYRQAKIPADKREREKNMAKSVNKVILIGNLGKDPELKHTSGGTAVCKFSVATADRYKDKDGNWQDRTDWHDITCWARLAEIAAEYLKKGRAVYIEGSLRTDSWDDKQTGQKRYKTYVNASDLVLLGGGRGGEEGGSGGRGSSRGSDFDQSGPGEFESAQSRAVEITDDDIPF